MPEPTPTSSATRAIVAGRDASGQSLAPALWASTTWESASLDDAQRRATSVRHGEFYSRYSNPTVRSFEQAMTELEGAEESLAFASGMGAIASTILALCSSGSHIVAQRQLYAGTLAFLQGPCARLGIETSFVDVATPGSFAADCIGHIAERSCSVPLTHRHDDAAPAMTAFITSAALHTLNCRQPLLGACSAGRLRRSS